MMLKPGNRPLPPSIGWIRGLLVLLSITLAAGCVSSEQLDAEKVRGLNFQRLLAQEEKRANALNAQLSQKDDRIKELNAQLEETKRTIASLESQNRELAVELDALHEQNQGRREKTLASSTLSTGTSKNVPFPDSPLSDPFMSEEELMKILEEARNSTKPQ